MAKDTVVGIAWALGLILVMAGVFAYESATFELDTYMVDLGLAQEQEDGTLAETESASFDLDVPGPCLREVFVVLSWEDDVGDADSFDVQLESDAKEGASAVSLQRSGSESPLTLSVSFGEPAEGSVDAASEADALAQVCTGAPWDGMRTFTVTVTLTDAPGQEVQGIPVQPDGSNAFTVVYGYKAYEAELME